MLEFKDQIKIGLLAIIAVTLIIQTINQDNPTTAKTNDEFNEVPISSNNSNLPQNLTATPQPQPQPEKPKGPVTSINFTESSFDFGNIKQNSTDNKHLFKFTNTGKNPLVIENAKGSCGCTVPQWPKEPIPPGGTGEIVVEYKPGKQKGNQQKTVTVTANTEPRDSRISISATVEEIPE